MPLIILILVAVIFSVFSAVVAFGHYFIYWSVKNFFGLTSVRQKRWLGVSLILLAFSFGAASALAHFSKNVVTQDFYFLAGLWLGVALNLDMAFGLGWITLAIGKFFGRQFNLKIIGFAAVSATIIFSGYGVWNAYQPKITEINVKIKNLPAAWQGKRAVQISDIHLGHVFGAEFLQKNVEKINALKPEIVFITGDLFDGMDGNLAGYVEPLDSLTAPAGVYYVTGNHETYLGAGRAYDALSATKVKILKDEEVNLDGLQIVGVSFPEESETRNIDEVIGDIADFDSEEPAILLYHSPFEVGRAKRAGVDLMLSGHTHDGQVLPFGILTKIIFFGQDYGLHEDGDFTLYTTSGLGTWGPTMRTFSRPEIVVINLESK